MSQLDKIAAEVHDIYYKKNGAPSVVPRVHGNGFIQIDLDPIRRLHIWGHPEIPRQKVSTQIHDHTFSFTSICLLGQITNLFYILDKGQEMRIWEAVKRNGEDTELVATDQTCEVRVDRAGTLIPGGHYKVMKGEFHETVVHGPAATIIYKKPNVTVRGSGGTGRPRVLCSTRMTPDNSFDRYSAAEVGGLWQMVFDVLYQRRMAW